MKMIHKLARTSFLGLLAVALLALSAGFQAAAQEPDYTLDWWTVDGGGRISGTSGGYSLGGSIGQPDAGVLSGEGYTLVGGFWDGVSAPHRFYLPLVLRNY